MLRLILQNKIKIGKVEGGIMTVSTMRFDPSVENKYLDVQHIDFNFGEASNCEYGIFFEHITMSFICISGLWGVIHI